MAAWFTVYCTRSVRHVGPADVAAALAATDLYTAAEGFGIDDDEAVEKAMSNLHVEVASGELGERLTVRYRPKKFRPLVVYLWDDKAQVIQDLAETTEAHLDGRTGWGINRVRSALEDVVELAAIELGTGQLQDMGLVIAGQVAEYLATAGAGIIRDPGVEWWEMRRGVPTLLVGGGSR